MFPGLPYIQKEKKNLYFHETSKKLILKPPLIDGEDEKQCNVSCFPIFQLSFFDEFVPPLP